MYLNTHSSFSFYRLLSLVNFVGATIILLLLRKFKSSIGNPMGKIYLYFNFIIGNLILLPQLTGIGIDRPSLYIVINTFLASTVGDYCCIY